MSKKPSSTSPSSWAPGTFALIDENGVAPDSRVPTSNDAYIICDQLKRDNAGRELKWARIFQCFNMFPPNTYSMMAKKELFASSNVPFGQMKYRVDNKKSPYFDMVMQRNQAANIITKEGNEQDKKIWSDNISTGWDRILRKQKSYRYNTELTLQEMLLYGKGFEFGGYKGAWMTTSLNNFKVLIPNDTYANLSNLPDICLKQSYTPLEFWKMIKHSKEAKDTGWNFWACVDAMRFYTGNYNYYKTLTEYLHALDSQSSMLNRVYNMKIQVYELYSMEYDGTITKSICLQNYGPIMTGMHRDKSGGKKLTEQEYRESRGYLFVKKKWAKNWDELICPFMCSSGSGYWHEVKGFAEGIYSQCRAHDIHMNKMMTAALINNTFMLKGGSAESAKKLKQMEWSLGGMTVLPTDCDPIQHRWQMPINETMQLMQYYTSEMDRGTGTYQINAPTAKGGQRTATESQNDVVEAAKLQGTEVRAYNDSQTRWQNMLYRRMCECTRGEDGFDLKEEFMEFMEDNKVPKDAWDYKNLESLESNMLGGAASPSFKALAADKLIMYAGMTAATPGQENAIQDGIAAYADRQNVARYRSMKKDEMPKDRREIGFENSALTSPNCNPENVPVLPEDNHLEHLKGHYSDAMEIGTKAMQGLQAGAIDADDVKDAHMALIFHGAHMIPHIQFLEKDPTKVEEVKKINQAMQGLQKLTDEVGSAAQQMAEAKQKEQGGSQGSPEDQKIQAQVALDALKAKHQKDMDDLKIGAKAQTHEVAMQTKKEKAATDLAIQRAKAEQNLITEKQKQKNAKRKD